MRPRTPRATTSVVPSAPEIPHVDPVRPIESQIFDALDHELSFELGGKKAVELAHRQSPRGGQIQEQHAGDDGAHEDQGDSQDREEDRPEAAHGRRTRSGLHAEIRKSAAPSGLRRSCSRLMRTVSSQRAV